MPTSLVALRAGVVEVRGDSAAWMRGLQRAWMRSVSAGPLHVAAPSCGEPAYRYDWLKKPFSISRAFSSAETSTLRGVRRKVFSAIFCMPPSRA